MIFTRLQKKLARFVSIHKDSDKLDFMQAIVIDFIILSNYKIPIGLIS